MKFICAWDNVACIVDNATSDVTGPAIVAASMIIAAIVASIWSKLK